MDIVEECGKPGRRRWRPRSLDLNLHGQNLSLSSLHPLSSDDASAISICSRSNMLPSPETPNYSHSGAGVPSYQKGWSSERITLSANRGRRYGGNALISPFNNGRTMPSKWEDAEKWICSPVSSDGSRRPLMLPRYQRRLKSKSGPLGTPALTGPSALLQFPCFENGRVVSYTGSSPFMSGVLMTEQQFHGGDALGRDAEVGHDGVEKTCPPNFVADRLGIKEPAIMFSRVTMRRDVGTQMSPEGSMHSFPKERSSSSLSPSAFCTTTDLESHFSCLETRDVMVDDRIRVTKWSKKHISWCSDRRSTDIIEWKRKMVESPEYDSEEAKLTACENPQKAQVESAVPELETKLEKRGSSLTGKILRRLRSAQRKADDMQSSVVERQARLVSRTGQRKVS